MHRTFHLIRRAREGTRRMLHAYELRPYLTAVAATLIGACVAAPGQAGEIDQAAKDYLEGIWLVGERPDAGSCVSHAYHKARYESEFEFRKTGGRMLIFEPPDLFTAISISRIDQDGELLTVIVQDRDGRPAHSERFQLLPPDRLAILSESDDGGKSPRIAYRCGGPDTSVNGPVPMEALAVLTPSLTGSQGFPEVQPGVSDSDLCEGRGLDPEKAFHERWLQFEVLGPVHYWVLGQGFSPGRRLEFDFVRSVRQLDAHTLKLEMQEHRGGPGWDVAESRGKKYELTIIDKGSRIEIPELSATFARCKADQPGSVGIHRW